LKSSSNRTHAAQPSFDFSGTVPTRRTGPSPLPSPRPTTRRSRGRPGQTPKSSPLSPPRHNRNHIRQRPQVFVTNRGRPAWRRRCCAGTARLRSSSPYALGVAATSRSTVHAGRHRPVMGQLETRAALKSGTRLARCASSSGYPRPQVDSRIACQRRHQGASRFEQDRQERALLR